MRKCLFIAALAYVIKTNFSHEESPTLTNNNYKWIKSTYSLIRKTKLSSSENYFGVKGINHFRLCH